MNRTSHCSIFTQCGLCSFLTVDQNTEKQKKIQHIESLLDHSVRYIDSPQQLGYRKRISLRCDKQGQLGYYQPKSHHLIPITQCAIADERINTTLSQIPPCPISIQSIELRTNGDKLVAQIYSPSKKTVSAKKIRAWLSPFVDGIALDQKNIFGDTSLTFTIGSVLHSFRPQSFYQINHGINTLLIKEIIAKVQKIQPTHILDLFAGAGNIGLALAKKGFSVSLMESAPSSCADARETTKNNNLNAKIIQASVEDYTAGSLFFDLLILDPPRAGIGKKIKDFVMTKPKNILYVSCHPASLKKDASLLKEEGYLIHDVIAFNMFPATKHIETLCCFRRENP